MFSNEDEISNYSIFSKELCKIKKEKSILNSIFELYYKLYHSKLIEEKSLLIQKVVESIESAIWCSQIASLLWIPHLPIANWDKNMEIWEIFGYSRLDNICSEMDLSIDFLYLSISITFTLFLSIIVLVFIIYRSFNIPRLVFDIFKWIFNLWIIIIFIPSTVIYSIFLKNNIFEQKVISEYKNNNESEKFEISLAWQILIILAMIINFLMISSYAEFSGEIRHSVNQKNIKARAHSKIEMHKAIFTYFSAIVYVLFDEDSMIYFQLIEMIVAIFITIEIIILLPYFSYYCNLMLILQFFTVAFISFGFILGHWIDNSLFIILFTIFVWPPSILHAIHVSWKYQKNLNWKLPVGLIGIKSKYQLEKILRHSMCISDSEHKTQIIYLFEKFFIENILLRDKLQSIWISNYCLYTLKDENLAKIKLCKSKKIPEWNMETNFQEYLCDKNIKNSPLSESSQYIDYFQQLIMIKKKDFKLCIKLLKFYEEITSYKPDLKRLSKSLDWVDKRIKFLDNHYTELTTQYFYSKEFLDLYASFSKDIIFDLEKSNFLESKLKSADLNMLGSYSKILSSFNETNGIFIISAEEDSFGTILFSNSVAKSITQSLVTIDGCNIMDIIPSYYREKMKEELNNILHYSSTEEIDLREGLFLNFHSNFIVECIGKVCITSIDNFFIFMLIFKQKETKNEIALISENGEICGYTKNFPKAVKISSEILAGFNIKKLFSEEKEFDLQWSVPYYLQNCETETILIFSWHHFYKLKVFYVLLMNDYEEIQKWKNNSYNNIQEENFALSRQLSLKLPMLEENNLFIRKKFYDLDLVDTDINLSPTNINNTTDADCNLLENKDENKYQVSEKPQLKNLLQKALMSAKSINILHAAFIISIIAVLSANISVLFFAISNINFIRNMDLPIVIGKIEKGMQNIAASAQILWVFGSNTDDLSKMFLYQATTFMQVFLSRLKSVYSDVTSDIKKWDYCSGRQIFFDESIYLWNSDFSRNVNLFEMMLRFNQLVKNI
ncbi:unnamed protein product [Blepharisma stoltei]|uniref:TmcB/TmcC TPR repeats domain-containing protein n=1 Tax=Blepharisma stoltei TaxID=1481888 RepID=A0AAU9I7X0_9CILI|nr:unnamed protein product [Blepharisma stoltei]